MNSILLASIAFFFGATGQTSTELTPESFDTLLAQIQPSEDELAWHGIDWRPSLGAAIVDAQSQNKPILLWAMNGHPLGCV